MHGQLFQELFCSTHSIEILIRYVEDLKRPVEEMLEECVWDETSRLFQLRGIWDSGVKGQSPKSKILKELEGYWKKLALQGRSLEEAARWTLVFIHLLVADLSIVAGLPVMGLAGSVVVKVLRATLSWQPWWRPRSRGERFDSTEDSY